MHRSPQDTTGDLGAVGDRGAARAVEAICIMVLTVTVVLAVVQGPVRDQLSCLAQHTIVLMESSGGSVCGTDVPRTRGAPGAVPASQP